MIDLHKHNELTHLDLSSLFVRYIWYFSPILFFPPPSHTNVEHRKKAHLFWGGIHLIIFRNIFMRNKLLFFLMFILKSLTLKFWCQCKKYQNQAHEHEDFFSLFRTPIYHKESFIVKFCNLKLNCSIISYHRHTFLSVDILINVPFLKI